MVQIRKRVGVFAFALFGLSVPISTALTQLALVSCLILLGARFFCDLSVREFLNSRAFRPLMLLCLVLLFVYALIFVRYLPEILAFDETAIEVVSKYKKLLFFIFLIIVGCLGAYTVEQKKAFRLGLNIAFYVICVYVISTFTGVTELALGSPAEKEGIFFWFFGESASNHWLAFMNSPGISFGRNYISQAFFIALMVAYEMSCNNRLIKPLVLIKILLGLVVLILMGGKTGIVFAIVLIGILSQRIRFSSYKSLLVPATCIGLTLIAFVYSSNIEFLAFDRFETWALNLFQVANGHAEMIEKSRLWFYESVITSWSSGGPATFWLGEGLPTFIDRTGSDNPHSEFLHGLLHGGILLVVLWAIVLLHLVKAFSSFYPIISVVSVAFFLNSIVWDFGEGYILAAFIFLMATDSGERYREA